MNIRMFSHTQTARMNAIAAAIAILGSGSAFAVEIDSGNEDVKIRWDNTVRYNLGMRMEGQDARILANPTGAYDESDAKFGKHDLVTNRLDLLSELDVNYKNTFGARVSGSAWYDKAYDNHTVTAPGGGVTSYLGNQYNSKVSRYVNGPSAEFLDAFVWSNFSLGVVPVNVKLGRHSIVWGEGLLLGAHAVSYSQAPVDGQKAVGSPGIETKEVFLPVSQLSFKAQVTSDLTIAGQYALDWERTRAPNGGTFLMGADTAPNVDRLWLAGPFSAANVRATEPGKRGNWGLSARLNVEQINSTFGVYYRRFNDYAPENGLQFLTFNGPLPATFRFNYPKDVKLIGASFARALGPVSFGSEISYRQNGQLNSKTTYVNYAGMNVQDTGARGNTLHAVANGVYLLPKTPLWDTGSLVAELGYSRLQKVTANEALYRGEGNLVTSSNGLACTKTVPPPPAGTPAPAALPGDKSDYCSTRNFWQVAVNFTPQYLGILPSWDLDLPLTLNYGIKGVAAAAGGGYEGALSWSVGAKMTYQAKHEFSLRYSDLRAPSKYGPNAAGNTALLGGGAAGSVIGATDRGWLVFTYKTSF
ncbi:MAG: hypothetical protein JWP96_748 [Polaromonas sp.]|nr:hypothetical protein [Polaromonas sp.]